MSYVYICVLFLSVRLSNDSCSYHKRPFSELRRNAANNSLLGVAGLGEEQPARFIGRLGPGKMAAHSINLNKLYMYGLLAVSKLHKFISFSIQFLCQLHLNFHNILSSIFVSF